MQNFAAKLQPPEIAEPLPASSKELLVEVEGISKKFARSLKTSLFYGLKDLGRELTGRAVTPDLRSDEFWALQGVGFQLRRGEAIGIIGHNGAGKSTLLKILTGLIKPTTGEIRMHGRVQALIELGSGMNPILTGRENIYINAAVMGIDKSTIDRKLEDIIAFAELEEFIDMPFQNYSSGMKVRLGFAIAINVDPDILIIDEVLSVGDSKFKRKARLEFEKLLKKDVAIIFVSHNLHEVNKITQRCIWLDRGQVAAFGETHKVISQYVSRAGDDETIAEEGFIAPPLEKSPDKSSGHMSLKTVTVNGGAERHISWDKAVQNGPVVIGMDLDVLKPMNDTVHFMWQICDEYGTAEKIRASLGNWILAIICLD